MLEKMELTNTNDKDRKRKRKREHSVDLSTMVYGKVPPQAKDLEEAILGAIMLEKNAFDAVSNILRPEAFYLDAHQKIYAAFQSLAQKSLPIDILTVAEELKIKEQLDIVGGPYFVTKLTNTVASAANIEAHARIVVERFIKREYIRVAGETISLAYEDSTDAFDLIDEHDAAVMGIVNTVHRGNYVSVGQLVVKAVERMELLRNNKGMLTGVPTGYPHLDRFTNGWQPTDLIIIGARPSVGKTAFALNLARNAVISKTKPTNVGVFSLEMSAGQLTNRLISAEGEINLSSITNGNMDSQDHYEHFLNAGAAISNMNLYIDDTAALNIFEFRARARRMVGKHRVGLIIIDYLQLMSGKTDGDVKLREQEISNISRNLKALAKELNIPIIALSQITRAIEKEKREPQLSDLRESGAIEQDADIVIFLTRVSYQKDEKTTDPSIMHDADLWIKKNRNGSLGKIPFKTVLSIQKWMDLIQYDTYQKKQSGLIPLSVAEQTTFIQKGSKMSIDDDGDDLPF